MLTIETPQEAYVAIMYACMSVDDTVTETETDELISNLVKSDLFDNVDMVFVYKKVQMVNQANRFNAFRLIELAAPLIGDQLKPEVYQAAVKLLKADGVVHSIEHELLVHLKESLHIP
jgi:uncharacterized tellurite resistance protein B-like protein